MGDRGAASLSSSLPRNSSLLELWIGDLITSEGGQALAHAIASRGVSATTGVLSTLCLGGTARGGVVLRRHARGRRSATNA